MSGLLPCGRTNLLLPAFDAGSPHAAAALLIRNSRSEWGALHVLVRARVQGQPAAVEACVCGGYTHKEKGREVEAGGSGGILGGMLVVVSAPPTRRGSFSDETFEVCREGKGRKA